MLKTHQAQMVVVGSGPAGLSTAHTLRQAGWDVLILERGVFAAGVARYPIYMRFFSTAELVELGGFPLTITEEKPTRQQYLRYLERFAQWAGLRVLAHHALTALDGSDGDFLLRGETRFGEPFEARAEKVVLATGAYDHPNRLGVPGEDLPHVSHYYREVNDHIGQKVLIVGGRHSASETALELARAGVDVTICYRRPEFSGLKYWVRPDLENRIKEGRIKALMPAEVLAIQPHAVTIKPLGEPPREVAADAVLALTGYRPDPSFLRRMEIPTDPDTGCPVFHPTSLESPRPGVYLAGVMLAGSISGAIFIENSRTHGQQILEHLGAPSGRAAEAYPFAK